MDPAEVAARYKLVIYDLDGTLCQNYHSWHLLPGRDQALWALHQHGVFQAIASNQGGPGYRLMLQAHGYTRAREKPTVEEVEARIHNLLLPLYSLVNIGQLPVYLCFAWYHDDTKKWWCPDDTRDPRWDPALRKPSGAMLRMACEHFGVTQNVTLMVGDGPEDEDAARAVACAYLPPEKFFQEEAVRHAPSRVFPA